MSTRRFDPVVQGRSGPDRRSIWPKRSTASALFGLALALGLCGVFSPPMALSAARTAPSGAIRYTISLAHPEQHIFAVTMQIPNAASDQTIAMPAWNALYQIRDFAYRVRDVRCELAPPATAAQKAAGCTARKLDKQTWRLDGPGAAAPSAPAGVSVRYTVEWNEPGPFSSQLDSHHAFLNLAEVLMYLPNRRAVPAEVSFTDVPPASRSIAELPSGGQPNSFRAASYDALVDAPVEIGGFDEFEFDSPATAGAGLPAAAGGAHFRVVVDGVRWNQHKLEDELRRITAYEVKMMGGAPFREYTFFFHIGPYAEVGGGGMEHPNSTAIAAGSVESAAAIAAHEFFHAWNVKRIRPQSLEPVDYTKEQFTPALWFAEGVTSTYASYTLERCGIWPRSAFYDDLALQITQLQSRPARLWQSAEESSLDTWFDKYDFYSRPDRSISYYNKGQILGVLLDLSIRNASNDRKSLDDVLRWMNVHYAQRGEFYDDSDGVRAAVEAVSGRSFADFFHHYVAGTDELPYDAVLAYAGLRLRSQTFAAVDLGFQPGPPQSEGTPVQEVEPNSPAESAGLLAGDLITKWNGHPAPQGRAAWLRAAKAGEPVTLRVDRSGSQFEVSYTPGLRQQTRYSIDEVPHATQRQRRVRDGWLRGKTQ